MNDDHLSALCWSFEQGRTSNIWSGTCRLLNGQLRTDAWVAAGSCKEEESIRLR
jgi:hypothetical protein